MRRKGVWLPSAWIWEHRGRRAAFYAALLLLPLGVSVLCLGVGRFAATPGELFSAISGALRGEELSTAARVLLTMRLPRVLLALLVGGGLGVAGLAFQNLFGNPLATPDTLGVASGSSFGAALGLLLSMKLLAVQGIAFAAGLLSVSLTFLFGRRRGDRGGLISLILAGIVVSSLFSALVSLVKFAADTDSQLPAITYWLMGSLASANYGTLLRGAPFILAGCALLYALRWRLNVLPLSDDEARATGTRLPLLRVLTVLSATMITASCVSMCGQVGWVGLLIPHICRMLLGGDNLALVPASLSLGATFLVLMDTAARSLTAAELPISILTALIGAPFFILLLRKTGGWSL